MDRQLGLHFSLQIFAEDYTQSEHIFFLLELAPDWFSFAYSDGKELEKPEPTIVNQKVGFHPEAGCESIVLSSWNKIILDIKNKMIMETAGWHLRQMKVSDMDGFWQISSCHTGAC